MMNAVFPGDTAVSMGEIMIHYREAGSGPPVVLLHINQQSSALMTELMQALAPRMRAIAVDYPSHGSSYRMERQPTIEDYARCVLEVMDPLGIGRFTALGEATGAAVAVAIADAAPDRVARVVLVNCPLLEPERAAGIVEELEQLRPADASGFGAPRTVRYMLEQDPDHAPMRPTQDWMDRINQAQREAGRDRWQALRALAAYDLGSALERLSCPTLLLTGEHFYFRHRVPEIARRVRHLRSETLQGARFCATWEFADRIACSLLGEGQQGGVK